jgi:hypothetical protein
MSENYGRGRVVFKDRNGAEVASFPVHGSKMFPLTSADGPMCIEAAIGMLDRHAPEFSGLLTPGFKMENEADK